jgi:hypothetical protein
MIEENLDVWSKRVYNDEDDKDDDDDDNDDDDFQ